MLPFSVMRVDVPEMLSKRHLLGIRHLLAQYQNILADDFTLPESLFENTIACTPYLWLLVDGNENVLGAASLTDVIPGCTACLHGAAMPQMRGHPAVDAVISEVFQCAFEELQLHKLKAAFDADNPGARGFCRRWGFLREACLREETQRNGQKRDALLYALFAERYLHFIKPLTHKETFHVTRT